MTSRILLLFLMTSLFSRAQSVFMSESGEVTFYSYAIIEDIKATSTTINSMYNSTNGEIAFMIPMRSFQFAKSLMQEHFNEKYIESDKYPHATFKGKVNEKIDVTKPGKYNVTAKGILSLHGKEKEISESGEMEVGQDHIKITTRFFVVLTDFDIKKPQILFNNIADTIEVKMRVDYNPFKKK